MSVRVACPPAMLGAAGERWSRRVMARPGVLSPVGLLLAAAMSVTNVMTDVGAKRALE